ncbi:MAG: hypothetical protein AABY22_03695, partial [Nanoarchaeota archaeon]
MKQRISNNKPKTLFVLSILTVLLTAILVSAGMSITSPSIVTQSKNASFTISITGNDILNIVAPTFPASVQVEDEDGNIAV